MKRSRWLAGLVLVLCAVVPAAGCKPASDAGTAGTAKPPEGPVAKVRVYADGVVTLDGHSVSMDDLRAELARHKARKGVVWLYKQNGRRGEPHPKALEVQQIVVEARCPISLSDREDFSTVLSPSDGQSRPRE